MTRAIADLYESYKDGHLYYDGAMAEQPAWYMECITAMRNAMNSAEADRIAEDKSNAS